MKRQGMITVAGVVLFTSILSMTVRAAETELVGSQTVWRVHLTQGCNLFYDKGDTNVVRTTESGKGWKPFDKTTRLFSPMAAEGWQRPETDIRHWGYYGTQELTDLFGGYGRNMDFYRGRWPVQLCIASWFGVADPAQTGSLTLTLQYIGGVVVSVNGTEVGRGHLPAGDIGPGTLAEDYPKEADTMPDGTTSLPGFPANFDPANPGPFKDLLDRYQKRIRQITLNIPVTVLRKGGNLLTIEIRRSPASLPGSWCRLGVNRISLTGSGAGVVPPSAALQGLHVWNATPTMPISDKPIGKFRGRQDAITPKQGMTAGSPYEQLLPLRIGAARNGTGSGQVVCGDPTGVRELKATLSVLTGPGGAKLPADAVRIRYAVRNPLAGVEYCDVLTDAPTNGVITAPVWLIAEIPKEQVPGWYTGALKVSANNRNISVPVQILVAGYTLPDPKENRSLMHLIHSPDAVAFEYGVEPWSDKHFQLMETSLALMGQLGNDVATIPVILDSNYAHRTGLIRFVKSDAGIISPDFSALERYLDLYAKYCGTPKAIVLSVWMASCSKELTTCVNTAPFSRRANVPKDMQVTLWDRTTGAMTRMKAPNYPAEDAEAFWKPVFDGVNSVVTKRGWPEKSVLLGTLSDFWLGEKERAFYQKVAPQARWAMISHNFLNGYRSDHKFLLGGFELGFAVHPNVGFGLLPALFPENKDLQALECLRGSFQRCFCYQNSGPMPYRMVGTFNDGVGNYGLDYWPVAEKKGEARRCRFVNFDPDYAGAPKILTVPGPAGALPTVRFQMLRESLQEMEARIAINQAAFAMGAEAWKPNKAKWDALQRNITYANQNMLDCAGESLAESLDWRGRVAATYILAGELAEAKTEASWEYPPQ